MNPFPCDLIKKAIILFHCTSILELNLNILPWCLIQTFNSVFLVVKLQFLYDIQDGHLHNSEWHSSSSIINKQVYSPQSKRLGLSGLFAAIKWICLVRAKLVNFVLALYFSTHGFVKRNLWWRHENGSHMQQMSSLTS